MISQSSNQECHAVLASLSERYPPLEGRSPTRYSPVRHSTQDRSPFRVRLACVRHAASVDSEPGSNSQVKRFVLGEPCGCPSGIFQTREACRLFCLLRLMSVHFCPRFHEDRCEPADTRRAGFDPLPLSLALELQRTVCTLYLVFKEPRLGNTCASRFSSPSSAALAASVLFRRTFQDYICSFYRVNKNFSAFLSTGPRKTLVVEPSLSKNRRRLLPSRRSERAHRLQTETTCLTEIQIVTI